MLESVKDVGIEEGIGIGVEKGIGIGAGRTLTRLLTKRFGSFSPVLKHRLENSRTEVLDRFAEAIFDFETLGDAEKWWDDPNNCGNA